MTEKETRLVEENVPLAVIPQVVDEESSVGVGRCPSAGEYGLVKAAMALKKERSFCFSTYAVSVMEKSRSGWS